MAKTKEETFLLSHYFNEKLSLERLKELESEYKNMLLENSLEIHSGSIMEVMLWAKRKKLLFGPYRNLTFFEISNRIYSDLILIDAANHLFEHNKINSIVLCMSNKGGNDMVIIDKEGKEIIGEAFNTAISFFKIKMGCELKKFKDGLRGVIAFNETALDASNTKYFEKKKKEFPNVEFLVCKI